MGTKPFFHFSTVVCFDYLKFETQKENLEQNQSEALEADCSSDDQNHPLPNPDPPRGRGSCPSVPAQPILATRRFAWTRLTPPLSMPCAISSQRRPRCR